MKKSFRDYHLLKLLESLDLQVQPIDVSLSNYFRANKALGSKDRREIGDNMYQMLRWMGLIDHHCEEGHSWEERVKVMKKLKFDKPVKDKAIPPHVRVSFPKELFQYLEDHFGLEKTLRLCHTCNQQAPITVRTNVLKTTRQALLPKWRGRYSVTPTETSLWGINFEERINFQLLDEFKKGFFEVQDEASQLVAQMVEAEPGEQVLDYCAGAGGKSLAFAHRLQGKGQIYLHDIRDSALQKAKRRLKRAGIENGQIILPNAPHLESLKGKMDWVLVDVPCTGTGTLRRNPDLKWKFSKELLQRLVCEQRAIFKNALEFLAPGGTIVYATCSLLPQENEKQIDYFQKTHHLMLSSKPFTSIPTVGGMDGFYGARLRLAQ